MYTLIMWYIISRNLKNEILEQGSKRERSIDLGLTAIYPAAAWGLKKYSCNFFNLLLETTNNLVRKVSERATFSYNFIGI